MIRKLVVAAMLFILGVASVSAASVDGKWKATIKSPRGSQEITFEFRAEGDALLGRILYPRGESPIQNGKIDGSNLSFTELIYVRGDGVVVSYSGRLEGDTIQLTRTVKDRAGVDFTATRVK